MLRARSASVSDKAVISDLSVASNRNNAARLSGVKVGRTIFLNFVIAGLAYGITGVALVARVSGAVGGSAGLFLELDAIAAAIIGGTSLNGGKGRVLGALVGALLILVPVLVWRFHRPVHDTLKTPPARSWLRRPRCNPRL